MFYNKLKRLGLTIYPGAYLTQPHIHLMEMEAVELGISRHQRIKLANLALKAKQGEA